MSSTYKYIQNLTKNIATKNHYKTIKNHIREKNATKEEYADELYTLTKNFKIRARNTRKKIGTLGSGTFGTANLEHINTNYPAVFATKYYKTPNSRVIADAISEIFALRYIDKQPNIVPFIGTSLKSAIPDKMNIEPNKVESQNIPAVILARADTTLIDKRLYKDININKIYSFVIQILKSINVLHSNNMVHSDIKPNNFLYNSAGEIEGRVGEVWLNDFGNTRYLPPNLPMHGDKYVGTLLYASPEIIMAGMINDMHNVNWITNDYWSVGCVIYFILTGGEHFVIGTPDVSNGERMSILNDMFNKWGKPTISDGYIYINYDKYKTAPGSLHYLMREKPGVLEYRIRRKTICSIPEKDIYGQMMLDKIIYITSQLLKYNPKDRMTIKTALGIITEETTLPFVIITKTIYENVTTFETKLDKKIIRAAYDLIYNESEHEMIDRRTRWIIVDRACHYFNAYISLYEKYIIKEESYYYTIMVTALTALYISASLFNAYSPSAYSNNIVYEVLKRKINRRAEYEDIMSVLRIYLNNSINAYGISLYDYINNTVEPVGIANFLAIRTGCYRKYNDRLKDVLKCVQRYGLSGRIDTYDEISNQAGNFTIEIDRLMKRVDEF